MNQVLEDAQALLKELQQEREYVLYEIQAVNEIIIFAKDRQDEKREKRFSLDEKIEAVKDLIDSIKQNIEDVE